MTGNKARIVLGTAVLAGAVTAWLLATVVFAEPMGRSMMLTAIHAGTGPAMHGSGMMSMSPGHEHMGMGMADFCDAQGTEPQASCTAARMNTSSNASCSAGTHGGMMMSPMTTHRGHSGCAGTQAVCGAT